MTDEPKTTEVKPKHAGGRPRKYKSVRQLTMAINRYFKPEDGSEVIPTKAGLAYFLGFKSKDALNEYVNYEEFSDLVERTFLRIEIFWTEKLAGSNCGGSSFWLKNNAGYTDKLATTDRTQVQDKPLTPELQAIVTKALNEYDESKRRAELKIVRGAG